MKMGHCDYHSLELPLASWCSDIVTLPPRMQLEQVDLEDRDDVLEHNSHQILRVERELHVERAVGARLLPAVLRLAEPAVGAPVAAQKLGEEVASALAEG